MSCLPCEERDSRLLVKGKDDARSLDKRGSSRGQKSTRLQRAAMELVDAFIDNKAVMHAWNNQGARRTALNNVVKKIFFSTVELNILLRMSYIAAHLNPADTPSRKLSFVDCSVSVSWQRIQNEFGGRSGHSCDLMPSTLTPWRIELGTLSRTLHHTQTWCPINTIQSWMEEHGNPLWVMGFLRSLGSVNTFDKRD